MTARPSGAFCPGSIAIGAMPMIIASAVIDHRPESRAARLQRGGQRVLAFRELLARETDDQNAVGRGDAHAHDRAGESGHGQGRKGQEQHPDDAGRAPLEAP